MLLHRELEDALSLTDRAVGLLVDARTGRNARHSLAGLLRQSIFSRLAGYEDVNEADWLCRDPVMRYARYAIFQLAKAALPRSAFAGVFDRINGLRDPTAEGQTRDRACQRTIGIRR